MSTKKNSTAGGRNNQSSMRGHSATISAEKFAKRPPSLNGINKQLP